MKRTDDLVSVADEDNKQLQMKTDDLLAMIRSSVERDLGPGAKSAHRMKETFADIDIDGNGKVDNKEFEKAMKKLNVNVTFREIDLIYQRFDKDKSGFIDYKEFLELMNFQNPHISKQLKIKTDDLVEKIRTEIELELGPGATNSRRIKEIFADIDRDGNGTIDKSEFEKAMKKLNVRITFREIDMLYERFDADNSGFMSYNGFLKLLDFTAKTNKIPDKIESNSKVNDLIDKIRRSIEDYLGPGASSARRIKEVFAAIDTNNNGEIDKREFEKAMIKLRVDLTSREIDMIFEKFDYNGSRSINYEEFLRFIDFDGSRNSNNRSRSSSGVDRDGGIDPRLKMKINDLLDKIRKNLHEELGAGATSARRVKQTFDDFDLDGNGELDKREFARAMIKLRVRLTADEIDLLYDRFDKNSNGTISYSEFLVLLDLDKNDTPEGKRSY